MASLIGGKRFGSVRGVQLVDVKVFGQFGSTATSRIIMALGEVARHFT